MVQSELLDWNVPAMLNNASAELYTFENATDRLILSTAIKVGFPDKSREWDRTFLGINSGKDFPFGPK